MRYTRALLGILGFLLLCRFALAANSVVVESKAVVVGAQGVNVGVYLENQDALGAFVVPLEFRSLDPGAYITDTLGITMQERLAVWDTSSASYSVMVFYNEKTDSVYYWNSGAACPADSEGLYWRPSAETLSFDSPNAVLFSAVGLDPQTIAAGSDGSPDSGSPSIVLTFDVTQTTGQFEIDTICIRPGNHLTLTDSLAQSLGSIAFTKSVITIGCECDCHADPICDSVHNVLDLVAIVGVAFQGADPIPDPNPLCPYETTDVNCDDVTDVLDVGLMNLVVNYGADPDSTFCDPCP